MSGKSYVLIGGSLYFFNAFRKPLINSLLKDGATKVTCIYFGNKLGYSIMGLESDKVEWVNLGGDHIGSIFIDILPVWRLYRALKKVKPSIILVFNAKPIFYGGLLSILFGKHSFVSLLEGRGIGLDFIGSKDILSRIKTGIFRISARANRKWIFLNKSDRKIFIELRLIAECSKDILINGIGTDLKKFKPDVSSLERWKKQSVAFVGRLIPEKGPHIFLEIAKVVKQKLPNVSFKIAGPMSDQSNAFSSDDIISWRKSGVLDSVEEHTNMVSFYKNISIAVLPTISEGLPAVAMEAQSSGIPMILNDIEQNERAISDGKTGYRVNDNEISTYANHIIELLTNKEKFIEFSENCRDFAEDNFDNVKTNKEIIDFINDGLT